jgi:hypothetical protein
MLHQVVDFRRLDIPRGVAASGQRLEMRFPASNDLQAMPDFILKKETIGRVKELIAQKKRLEAERKMKE